MIIEFVSLVMLVAVAGSILWIIGNIIVFFLVLLALAIGGILLWPFIVGLVSFILGNWIIFLLLFMFLIWLTKRKRL
ncbi:hypothetical protein SAMN02745174_01910 [Cetobacterium ceti]|uniref:Uncharacterized protein n=1 Tax=Cetobacterium ceti TaxID=180163 RepID=A0A1T4PGA9_9FUSO|nr:hypothetical protein [Cetobacterium ceti]SJZ90594.1 hypothetical protein SAMN02745174_01910 [Cetobacterium ceti]